MDNRWKQARQILLIGAVLALIWVGLWLRLLYLERPYFDADEYGTMLAARAVAEHGVPVLPSGLFYDPEIAFSYFSGLFVFLLGASPFVVRWASVFFGILSIPMAYVTARRIFSSPLAGVAAATFLAAAPDAVLWGGRARRYSMGEFLILLLLLLIWRGAVEGNNRKYRIFFYVIVCVVAGLTFLQALVVLPPLLLALLLLSPHRDAIRRSILSKQGAIEALVIVLALVGLYWRATNNFLISAAEVKVARSLEAESASSLSKVAAALSPFLFPTFDLHTALVKINSLLVIDPLYQVLAIPVLLAITLSLVPNFDRTGKYRRAVWFLLIVAGGVLFEYLFIISEESAPGRSRYLFVTFWPAVMMVTCGAAVGLERLARRWRPPARFKLAEWGFVPVMLLPLVAVLAVSVSNTLGDVKTVLPDEINYRQALEFVADHWQPGDQVMTILPIVSYWYLGRTDYFAADKGGDDVFRNSKSEMVDRRIGARWVSTPEELDAALRQGRVWFITDKYRLRQNYSKAFQMQILVRMELVFEADETYVLLPKAKPGTIPSQPDVQVEARLAGQVELTGFSLDQAALLRGAPAQLTLFWKALQPMADYKVFVHLRDRNGRTVAQADHIPSEALVALPTSAWPEGRIVPDVTYLQVPADTPPGEYQLLVGMYNADTMERLAVEGDTTGENAVVITTLRRP